MIKKIIILLILAFYAHRAWGMDGGASRPGVAAPSMEVRGEHYPLPGLVRSPTRGLRPRLLGLVEYSVLPTEPVTDYEEGEDSEDELFSDDLPPLRVSDSSPTMPSNGSRSGAFVKKSATAGSVHGLPDKAVCEFLRHLSIVPSESNKAPTQRDIEDVLRGLRSLKRNNITQSNDEIVCSALEIITTIDFENILTLIEGSGFVIDTNKMMRDVPVVLSAMQKILQNGLDQASVGEIIIDPMGVGVMGAITHGRSELAATLSRIIRRLNDGKDLIAVALSEYVRTHADVVDYAADVSSPSPSDRDGRVSQ